MLLDVCRKYKGIEHLIVAQKCDFSKINKSKNLIKPQINIDISH